jgi:multidrug efflux pump subunit AcrA (membrane-fusion protein)
LLCEIRNDVEKLIDNGLFNAAREKIHYEVFPIHRITAFRLLDSIKEAKSAQKKLTKQLQKAKAAQNLARQQELSRKELARQQEESARRIQSREKVLSNLKESKAAAWEAFSNDLIGPEERPTLTHNPFANLEMAIEASETVQEPQEPSPSTPALPEPREAIKGLLEAVKAVGQLREVLDLVGESILDRPLDKKEP